MEIRIKKYFIQFSLLVIAGLFFGLLAPAYADFKKVNERELARANASLSGQIGTIQCPDPTDANEELEESDCVVIPAEKEFIANEGSLSSVYTDYGYNWWKNNLKVAGDLYYYEEPSVISPFSVEFGSCGFCGGDSEYVRIGLGSQEIEVDSKDYNMTLGSKAAAIAGPDQILGTIYLAGLTVKTNGNSYVDLCIINGKPVIYSQVNVTIDRIDLATLSWGDDNGCQHDGAGNTDKAGYVGLKNTRINDVTASGKVAIEVGEIIDDQDNSITKSVHIGIGKMDVGIASLDTTVVLGDKKDFSGYKYTLGTLYMNNLKMRAIGSLDIYNPADNDKATSLGFDLNVPWLQLDTLSWGDPDGVGNTTAPGFVGLRNLVINNLAIAGVVTIQTIAVQAGDLATAFVRVEFSKVHVGMDTLDTDVALGPAKDNLDQVLGHVYLGGLKTDINGTVDIHTHSPYTQGIVFDLNLKPTNVYADALSWGDADGVGGNTTAGYRGSRDMSILGVMVAGKVTVDVATVDANMKPVSANETLFASYGNINMSPTFVHIGLGTGNADDNPVSPGALIIGVNLMSLDAVVGSSKSLDSSNAGVLRSFYMSDLSVRTNGWIHVSAH